MSHATLRHQAIVIDDLGLRAGSVYAMFRSDGRVPDGTILLLPSSEKL